jgi:MerR family transcriptional regulator, thiopeptide resistance regulator
MEANRAGIDLTPAEMLEVFDGFDPSEHAAEAEERWGHTDAWA